ncbi:MAG: VOC family protein [Rhizobiales bacterium]|nr:VOC family protein [Hyphomicrobiales bacterium]
MGARPRGLDHIVHAVRDLDVAAQFYSRAGFQVGARNTHPWGTQNHVVQFDGFFIELLTVAAPEKLTGEGLAQYFGIPNRDAIARGDGFSFLLLESRDIAADVEDLERHKIGSSPALPFTREARLPDGATTTIGFTLAFARDDHSPQTGFALCRQSNPQAFWNSDYQRHPNGARGVVAAILVADNPADHHIFLSAFTGMRVLQSSSTGVIASTPRGDVEIMDSRSFRDRFGVAVAAEGEGMRLAGLRLATRSLAQTETALTGGGVTHHRHVGRLVIPPQAALGATLVFEEATAS